AEQRRVRRILGRVALLGVLVPAVEQADGRIILGRVLDGRVLLDPRQVLLAVVQHGIEALRAEGVRSVLVVGHPLAQLAGVERGSRGWSEVCARLTAARHSRVDSRAMGSSLFGSAMSSWKASHSEEHPPADPPVAPMRFLSMFHSFALERTNCNARAASCRGA